MCSVKAFVVRARGVDSTACPELYHWRDVNLFRRPVFLPMVSQFSEDFRRKFFHDFDLLIEPSNLAQDLFLFVGEQCHTGVTVIEAVGANVTGVPASVNA